jgi:hypothetical protein
MARRHTNLRAVLHTFALRVSNGLPPFVETVT